jgi:hypothetical protein
MSSIKFNWYDNWKKYHLNCECGWKGELDDERCENHDGLMDFDCPNCKTILATILYPTLEESKQNWDKLDNSEKEHITRIEAFQKKFEEESLKSSDQLPDLHGNHFVFVWDSSLIEGKTVILFGEKTIWSEPTQYEGYERFVEILEILKAKYGDKLKDFIPTEASQMYLLGDRLNAGQIIEEARSKLIN